VIFVALVVAVLQLAHGFNTPVLLRNPNVLAKGARSHNLVDAAPGRRGVQLRMAETKSGTKAEKEAEVAAEEPKKENMMTKVKNAGIAGLISYAAWEFVFWTVSVPAAIFAYHQTTGEWPSFDNPESTAKVSAVVFGFLNVARALVPVRIGITLATVPLVDKYIVKPLGIGKNKDEEST